MDALEKSGVLSILVYNRTFLSLFVSCIALVFAEGMCQ